MIRTYTELMTIPTFEERFKYLKLEGLVGAETFGGKRMVNQSFYRSREWKRIRDKVIIRDNGCDLGIEGREIYGHIVIHHMNPLMYGDIKDNTDFLLNPEYLICVSHNTHNAIHYSDEGILIPEPLIRTPNDTCPWRK